MSRLYCYVSRTTARNGATVTELVNGSSALAALRTAKRRRRGDWTRIEIGTGEDEAFQMLQECSR